MSAQLLTKVLPHGVSLNTVGKGAKVNITPSDVAAALGYGNMHPAVSYFALAKYCADESSTHKLLSYFDSSIKEKIRKESWVEGLSDSKGLAYLLMMEGVYGVQCKKCKGKGEVLKLSNNKPLKETCPKCQGTKIGTLSQRERARTANISSSTWDRHWKYRMNELLTIAYDLDLKLNSHLKTQFYS